MKPSNFAVSRCRNENCLWRQVPVTNVHIVQGNNANDDFGGVETHLINCEAPATLLQRVQRPTVGIFRNCFVWVTPGKNNGLESDFGLSDDGNLLDKSLASSVEYR